MKKHLVTIRCRGTLYTFLVTARISDDGRARISRSAWAEINRRVAGRRGDTITVG